MKQLLNNPWVVGGLCVAAIITVYLRLFDTKSRPVPSPPVEQAQVRDIPTSPPPETTVVQEPPPGGEPDEGHLPIMGEWIETVVRDPFQKSGKSGLAGRNPLQGPSGDPGALPPDRPFRLHAIFVDDTHRVAVINNTFVRVGDEVLGFRVSRIKQDRVLLQNANRQEWVEFDPAQERAPAS